MGVLQYARECSLLCCVQGIEADTDGNARVGKCEEELNFRSLERKGKTL